MISRNAPYLDLPDLFGTFVAPLLRQFWMIVLIVTAGAVAALAYGRMQAPSFEASAVVQTGPGVDVAAAKARLTTRGKAHNAALIACARKLLIYANTVVQRGTPWTEKALVS